MQNLNLSKKIIIAVVCLLIVVIIGLIWNIGRNQKPSQKLVDELTSLVNKSQNSNSSSEPNFTDLVNIAQSQESSNNSNTNQTFPESQLISNSSTFSAFSSSQFSSFSNNSTNNLTNLPKANSNVDFEIPNTNGQNSQSFPNIEVPSFRNSQSSNSVSSNYDSGWILSEQIKGEIQNYKIESFGQSEIYKIPATKFDEKPLILANLIKYPTENPTENLYILDTKTSKMAMLGNGVEKVFEFGNNREYRLILASNMMGFGQLFRTNDKFENPQKIVIKNGENVVKITKTGDANLFQIEINNSQRTPIPNTKYLINMNKILENKPDFLEILN